MKGTIMRKFEIEQHRIFTSDLFSGTAFDDFLLKEATVVTYAAFQIDGQIRKDFFDQEDPEESLRMLPYAPWSVIKPHLRAVIKGKRLPLQFQIVLLLPPEHPFCLENPALRQEASDQTLFLNIIYREQKLVCTTGASMAAFVPGIHAGQLWDETASRFITRY
jgi:hypothetical protein